MTGPMLPDPDHPQWQKCLITNFCIAVLIALTWMSPTAWASSLKRPWAVQVFLTAALAGAGFSMVRPTKPLKIAAVVVVLIALGCAVLGQLV